MSYLPMIYVIPLTGPDKDQGRSCIVCKAGSFPAIAAFVKPNPDGSIRDNKAVAVIFQVIERITKKYRGLRSDVIILNQAQIVPIIEIKPRGLFQFNKILRLGGQEIPHEREVFEQDFIEEINDLSAE